MRVCMLAYTHYDVDNRVMRYAEALVRRGDTVDAIVLRREEESHRGTLRGVNLFRIQKRNLEENRSRLGYLLRLSRFLIKSALLLTCRHICCRYSVIHVHSIPDFEVFAAFFPRLLGAKVILDIHDLVPELYRSKFKISTDSAAFHLLLRVERASTAFAHHTIVANDIWRSRLISRSTTGDRCTTIMNYPDVTLFSPQTRQRDDDRFVVLYPGTISYHQGLDIAVRAFKWLERRAPRAELHIYGGGPERRVIENLIRQLALNRSVIVRNPVPITSVPQIMADSDLGVIPKRADHFGGEAFSTKSLEFMAMGVPVVMADTPIDRMYFSDALVAFFSAGNPEDLGRTILRLYEDAPARERLATASQKFIAENNWSRKQHEYFDVLGRL